MLFVAAFVWLFNSMVNLAWSAPVLFYEQSSSNLKSLNDTVEQHDCSFLLTNRSQITAYHNLHIMCVFRTHIDGKPVPDPRKIAEAEVVVISPSAQIDSQPHFYPDSESVRFDIPVMQPASQYELRLTVVRNKKADEYPKLYLTTDQAVQLRLHDFRDSIVGNFFLVNLILLVLILYVIFLYTIFLFKKGVDDKK